VTLQQPSVSVQHGVDCHQGPRNVAPQQYALGVRCSRLNLNWWDTRAQMRHVIYRNMYITHKYVYTPDYIIYYTLRRHDPSSSVDVYDERDHAWMFDVTEIIAAAAVTAAVVYDIIIYWYYNNIVYYDVVHNCMIT